MEKSLRTVFGSDKKVDDDGSGKRTAGGPRAVFDEDKRLRGLGSNKPLREAIPA
jgi:hypothetical protein